MLELDLCQNHIKSIYGPYMGQGPPPIQKLDLCHIKTISNPYMGHIWVKDHPRCPSWTLDFSPRFCFPLSPRSIFHTSQRFLLPNHVTSGCMSPRSLFPVSGFEPTIPLATTGQRFALPVSNYENQSEARTMAIWAPFTTRFVSAFMLQSKLVQLGQILYLFSLSALSSGKLIRRSRSCHVLLISFYAKYKDSQTTLTNFNQTRQPVNDVCSRCKFADGGNNSEPQHFFLFNFPLYLTT